MIAQIFGWILRHALVFILLIAGMAIYGKYRESSLSSAKLKDSIARIEGAKAELQGDLDRMQSKAVTVLQDRSKAAIDARLATARAELAAKQRAKPSVFDVFQAPQSTMVAGVRHEFDISRMEQEIAFLGTLQARGAARGKAFSLDDQIANNDRQLAALENALRADDANIDALPSILSPKRYVFEGGRLLDLQDVYKKRQEKNRTAYATSKKWRDDLVSLRSKLGEITELATPELAVERLATLLDPLKVAATSQGQKLEDSLEREAKRWWDQLGIDAFIWPAVWALVAIILTTFAIRTLFYWVLAPLASLREPIRLLEPAESIPLPAERSAVSKGVRLGDGSELLVKQGFLQTSSQGGVKATQWLLDASHPISSLTAGLWFLTRIRGPGMTTVSAVRDPFAEITRLELPVGAACVLQPRAIVGVVQPIAAPLRVTSHWRLGKLNAWLTWQLRFLVFHGPADIILSGGRGVRVEPAEAGRSIGQDQLIGFSAGLSYSTGRAETFLPYLFGQEDLLRDRIAAGSGILIVEEAPRAGQAKTGIKPGLEGAADAFLKVFGI